MKENLEKTILPNGLRIVTERIPYFRSATIGIWVDVGSANEDESNRGISHFLEHLMFKGTPTRNVKEIAQIMDGIGGNLNAFTEKEQTCFYAKVMDKHIPIAMELLGDMLLHSHFPAEEVEKEKGIVLEEIKMYEDSPDELVFDLVTQAAWKNHPLGQPILGTEESVYRITREKLLDFVKEYYTSDQIVISVTGRIKHEEIIKLVEKFLPFLPSTNGKKAAVSPPQFTVSRLVKYKDTEQVHLCLAMEGIPQCDERRYPLMILDTILGGSVSSRLFQEIREKLGLAYSISSFQGAYARSAIFGIYAATSPAHMDIVVKRLLEILNDIIEKGVTHKELKSAKEHLKGALSLTLESPSNRMIRLAKNEFYYNRFISHKEILKKLQAVGMEDLRSLAREFLKPNAITWAILGPVTGEISLG